MEESEINHQLKSKREYLGSFAVDELTQVKVTSYPCFIIINLDKRKQGGSHWIALAIYMKRLYICDSLGGILPDDTMSYEIVKFLRSLLYNRTLCITRQLQPLHSELCGYYCILFIKQMATNHSFIDFINLFTKDKIQNDKIVTFLNKRV